MLHVYRINSKAAYKNDYLILCEYYTISMIDHLEFCCCGILLGSDWWELNVDKYARRLPQTGWVRPQEDPHHAEIP